MCTAGGVQRWVVRLFLHDKTTFFFFTADSCFFDEGREAWSVAEEICQRLNGNHVPIDEAGEPRPPSHVETGKDGRVSKGVCIQHKTDYTFQSEQRTRANEASRAQAGRS